MEGGGIAMSHTTLRLLLEYNQHPHRVCSSDKEQLVDQTLDAMKHYMVNQEAKETIKMLLSTENFLRKAVIKSDLLPISNGDVAYIDFGHAYLHEAGYQHFGLVLSMANGKVFVVPMTSNPNAYAQAYDSAENPLGKKHLMRVGLLSGLNRPSVLFLNDCKFISSTRVIEIKGHLSVTDPLFAQIRQRVRATIFNDE
jgi:hypothetical protein